MNTATLSAGINGNSRIEVPVMPIVPPTRIAGENRFESNNLNEAIQPGKGRKLSPKRVVLVALIFFVGLGTGKLAYDWWTVGRFIQTTDDAYVGGDVTVIAPEVAGFVAQVAVKDNQQVHAGDLLIKLDDRDYRAALAKADAAVAMQQAALTNLDATRHLQAAVIDQAKAEIAATDAETVRTHDDQVRFQKLLGTGAISIQGFQQADSDYKRALAAGAKSQAALDAAQRQLDVIASQKQQAQAALQQALAQRESAQLNLGYTELRAPMDGIVGNRSAQTGAYATTGAQLISLVPAHGLWIDANFKENQLAHVRPGSPATVKVDLLSDKIFRGHVVSIAPATGAQFSVLPPENATGNFTKIVQRVTVRIVIDDDVALNGQLRPGLSVTAKVDTRSNQKVQL